MLKVFLPIPTKPTFRSDSLMPFTADLILAERDDITQQVGRIGWFDEKRAADTPNSGHSLERHTRPLWVITSHYAKAIDEEIERRRDASPARQKSNRTSCLEMLDY
jgi:hypothetical protein